LIANSLKWKSGDKVLCSDKEHNSNLVPWLIAKQRGIKHEIFRFGDIEDFTKKVKGTRLVSIVYTSNVDGTSNPVREMIKIAHEQNALVLLDAAQSAPHKEVDVRRLDCDFLVCSAHKMLGPSGMGILYGKSDLLGELNQFIVGGETVSNTTYNFFVPEKIPERFEGGLQNYGGIIGLAEALRYLQRVGLSDIEKHEQKLNERLTLGLLKLGVDILGPKDAKLRGGITGFNIGKANPHDVSLMLDSYNIATRSGMHCAHSWFNAKGMNGSSRASFYLYNTEDEVDFMLEKMKDIVKIVK
jgi:cysteine desulfurase/selenocysteine lyase